MKILIADDEARWRRLVGDFLRGEGYEVCEAENGREAVAALRREPDLELCILDVMMPEMDGIAACRKIREFSAVPVMILTARDDDETELFGFDCGADEFISKPLKFAVFLARVRALLKRTAGPGEEGFTVADIHIDTLGRTVAANGDPVALTPREYELLLYFVQHRNIALSREQILSAVWNIDYFGDARTVDTHVKNLRMKLGNAGDALKTVRGRGYKLEDR
ncbi:MAG: response regulator transcription factor [Oscillospiraceae bacterium]|nr:response regulator transcription factor [Oscillospiraceae bacterium]